MRGYDGAAFRQAVLERFEGDMAVRRQGGCWVCAYLRPGERQRCFEVSRGLPLDAHHLLPKRTIKREAKRLGDVPAALMDPRNGIPVRRYHHDALERRMVVPSWEALPPAALDFAAELGLTEQLRRIYP